MRHHRTLKEFAIYRLAIPTMNHSSNPFRVRTNQLTVSQGSALDAHNPGLEFMNACGVRHSSKASAKSSMSAPYLLSRLRRSRQSNTKEVELSQYEMPSPQKEEGISDEVNISPPHQLLPGGVGVPPPPLPPFLKRSPSSSSNPFKPG